MKKQARSLRILLQKTPKKLACSLAAAAMVVTTLVTANPLSVKADERDINVNPQINIQHYLYFSAVSLGEMKDPVYVVNSDGKKVITGYKSVEYAERTKNDWDSKPWESDIVSKDYGTVLPIYNTETRFAANAGNALPQNGQNYEPKYGVVLNDEGKFSSHIRLKQLFQDETVDYLTKPQLPYMNRLYNSDENANGNYTLREIWISKPDKKADVWSNPRDLSQDNFNVLSVPFKRDDNGEKVQVGTLDYSENENPSSPLKAYHDPIYLRDPSKVTFTNNPDYIDAATGNRLCVVNGTAVPTYFDETGASTEFNENTNQRLVIPVSEQTTIRFAFDPTQGTQDMDADFFDYDISDGYVYTSSNVGAQTEETGRYNTGYQQEVQKSGTNVSQWPTLYASTGQKGINSPENYIPGNNPKLAFGNSNTGSGLATQVLVTSGVPNYINRFNNTNRGTPSTGTGAVFGLAAGMSTDEELIWNEGISAPAIFTEGATQPNSNEPLAGKTDYIDEYSLEFKRVGGTYALQYVNKNASNDADTGAESTPVTGDLTYFTQTSGVWANQFWPLDSAESYGTDGHDMKFGLGTPNNTNNPQTKYSSIPQRQFVGETSTSDNRLSVNGGANDNGLSTGNLPPADNGQDHNAFFGMKSSVDFYLDPGYSGPLRYYFYGDDDLFVFLSEVDDEGNIIKGTTKQIADIGGVHLSVGMYVNLWQYVNDGKGPIDYKEEDGTPSKTKRYRLNYFYSERGESGSSCYMRFTLPFESITPKEMEYTGMIQVEKEVKGNQDSDEEYSFQIELKYPNLADGTPVTNIEKQFDDCAPLINRYQYEIWQRNADGEDVLIRQSLGDPDDESDDDYVYNGKVMKLKHNQYLKIFGLPGQMIDAQDGEQTDPDTEGTDTNVPTATLYKVTELDLDPEGVVITTFASGTVNSDGTSKIESDFTPGKEVMGTTGEENYVKFINATEQGALILNKEVTGDTLTTEPFVFEVSLETPEGSNPLTSLPVIKNGMEEADIPLNDDGKFIVTLKWNKDKYDTVTLYDIPLKSKYTVTEITDGNYLPSDITVTGGTENKTTLTTGTAEGVIDADGPITNSNRPFVTVNYTNIYAPNAMAQINVNKTIDGRNAANGGEEFTFKLVGDNDLAEAYLDYQSLFAELTVPEGKNKNEKPATFAPMYFTKEGTYVFKVTEMGGGSLQNGLKYDDSEYQVTVDAAIDPDTGDMTATTSWTKGNQASGADNGDTLEFVNKTELAADAEIGFAKNIQGEGIQGDEYEFKIKATTADTPMPANDTVTITNDGKETRYDGKFGPIRFTRDNLGAGDEPKSYKYIITESQSQAETESKSATEGLITDDTVYTATIEVSKTTNDQEISSLEAKLISVTTKDSAGNDVDASDTGVVFNNIYQSTDAVIKVRKTLDGRSMREGETFAFELREKGSDEVLQTLLIKGEAGLSEKEGTFQPITFKKTGTHEYIVTEVKGNDSDITYDETDHDVTVTIGEDDDRQLTASVKYDNSETDQALNITNVWEASVEWAPSVMKETLGGSPEGYNFEMNLTAGPEGGAEVPENCTATSDAAGKITFDKIRFTKPGKYTVTVHETKGTDDKIEYDDHTVEYQLEVTASDADSKLSVTETVDGATTFTNDAGLRISKTIVAGTDVTLTKDDYDKLFEFTLSLKDQDRNALKGPFATTIREADGTFVREFSVGDGSTFELSHNQTAYVYGLPSGTLYQVKETPEDGWFSVESLVNSGSTGPGAYQTPSFTNVKMSADTQLILGYKALTGTDGMNRPGLGLNSFTFKIEPVEAEVEDVPQTDPDDEQEKPAQETVPDSDEDEQPAKEEGGSAAEPEQPADPDLENNVQEVALPKIISQKTTLRPGDPDFPMPAQTEVSSSVTGVIDFGEIKYTQAGTYQYKVTEINKTDPEITYSEAEWIVTVTVKNIVTSGNVTGVKVTDVKYESNGQTDNAFTFINDFVGTPALDLHKSLSINGGPETDVEEAQPVQPGDMVTYYLTASVPEDKATAAAKNVVITDVIPTMNEDGDQDADLVLLNKGTASSYDEASRKLTWSVGDIPVGESVTVSWSVRVPVVKKTTSWTNIAAATYSNNPNNPNPNKPEEIPSNEVTVETEPARPDVTIHKAQSVNRAARILMASLMMGRQS